MIMLEKQELHVDKFIHWLTTIGSHVKYVQVAVNINVLFGILNSTKGCNVDGISKAWKIKTSCHTHEQ
jgi:hypothetical protein